jgi:N-acetylglucosamine kinase-like BadF-type ATPase
MNPLHQFVIGLDGGGTKTAAELFDSTGRVLSDARGGPSNFLVIGAEQAAAVILDLCVECCSKAGIAQEHIGNVVAGLTGAGRLPEQQRMVKILVQLAVDRKLGLNSFVVESDARIALEGAFSGNPGIIVIAGTGSIVFGKDSEGVIHRAGGWGRIVGDEGSGYSIGREVFRVVARIIDGRIIKSNLLELLSKEFHLSTQLMIVDALYKQQFDVASVVPLALKAAETGDTYAKEIFHNAALDLLGPISNVVKKIKPKKREIVPLAFIGSLLSNQNLYSKRMSTLIKKTLPQVRVSEPEGSPIKGAGIIGRRLLEELLAHHRNKA